MTAAREAEHKSAADLAFEVLIEEKVKSGDRIPIIGAIHVKKP